MTIKYTETYRRYSTNRNGNPRVAKDGRKEELEAVARLAEMCLKLKGEERPAI